MKLTELFLADLERDALATRAVLERVPEGKNDWKPHPRSMNLGYLAALVATMPGWIDMIVHQDELDVAPVGGKPFRQTEFSTRQELIDAHEAALGKARAALAATNDDHLMTPWSFKMAGKVADEKPRHIMIRDAVLNHIAHHRGQLTVFLRLNETKVPAIFGPSADEGRG